MGFVVEPVGVQAVMQLAEELVEQVPLCLGVTVPVVSASPVMRVGSRRRAQRAQGPQEPRMCQSLILDVAMGDDMAFAAGAGDRRGAGIGFQRSGIGETGSVVADFGEHPGGGQRTETGETEQDPGIGVLVELGDRRGGEVVCGCAGCVELPQQGQYLLAIAASTCGRGCR
jgi:hypothetical protein